MRAKLQAKTKTTSFAVEEVERIVDPTWLKKLDDEGFFEKMYKSK